MVFSGGWGSLARFRGEFGEILVNFCGFLWIFVIFGGSGAAPGAGPGAGGRDLGGIW